MIFNRSVGKIFFVYQNSVLLHGSHFFDNRLFYLKKYFLQVFFLEFFKNKIIGFFEKFRVGKSKNIFKSRDGNIRIYKPESNTSLFKLYRIHFLCTFFTIKKIESSGFILGPVFMKESF